MAAFNDIVLTREAGAKAAKYVQDVLGQKPKAVVFDLLNFPGCHDPKVGRMAGFVQGIQSVAPDAEMVFWDDTPFPKDESMAKMEDILQATPDFNIFTGCGGDQILGGLAALEAAGRLKATDKKPATEWAMTIDGSPEEFRYLLDPQTSVMEVITMTPKENSDAMWRMMKAMICGDLGLKDPLVVDLPGKFVPTDDCQAAAKLLEEQYGQTDVYEPIDCSKYGG